MPLSFEEKESIKEDFSRDVWCLFGLPIDNLSLKSTIQKLEFQIKNNKKQVLSTVNINWLVTSFQQPEFRATIINSDICTIDGVPLLWLGKMIGLPMSETVAGSTLTQKLRDQEYDESRHTIFFFGGENGVAQTAIEKLNQNPNGLIPVGCFNPGFGCVDDFISEEIFLEINKQSPNILLVALGALKGQAWIFKTKDHLNANIITHLGATINFLAGSVKRAPTWIQKYGLEWIWRIFEEPVLFKRYFFDGLTILKWFLFNLLILKKLKRINNNQSTASKGQIHLIIDDDSEIIQVGRFFLKNGISEYTDVLTALLFKRKNIVIDFKKTEYIDNRMLGLLLLLLKHQKVNDKKVNFINVNRKLDKLFRLNMFDLSLKALKFPEWKTRS